MLLINSHSRCHVSVFFTSHITTISTACHNTTICRLRLGSLIAAWPLYLHIQTGAASTAVSHQVRYHYVTAPRRKGATFYLQLRRCAISAKQNPDLPFSPETNDEMVTQAAMIRQPYLQNFNYHTSRSDWPQFIDSLQYDAHARRAYGNSPMTQAMDSPETYLMSVSSPHDLHPLGSQHCQAMTFASGFVQSRQRLSQPVQLHPQPSHSQLNVADSKASQQLMTRPPPGLVQLQEIPQARGGSVSANTQPRCSGTAPNGNAASGPVPATTPVVVHRDKNGVEWIAFEYSRNSVKMEYTIRCDVTSVNTKELSQDFRSANCIYPRAWCSKDQYQGKRFVYESKCNALGWALASLNPPLREKRGLIQRAVDSWRNSNQDPRLRSRRVRRMDKTHTRKQGLMHGAAVQLPRPPALGSPLHGISYSNRPHLHYQNDGDNADSGFDGFFHPLR